MDAVKSTAAQRRREQHAHEAKMQRQMLDWIQVVHPKRGDILVLRVPNELFVYPGTDPAEVSDAQKQAMIDSHQILGTLLQNVGMVGIQLGGAAIIGEDMTLEDLPPPWEKHPDAEEASIPVVRSRLLLPPGVKTD